MEEKIKVLIIDDDPSWKNLLHKYVSGLKYEPIVAKDAGYDLMHDALHLNNLHCCHIALVDMNLFDYPTGDDSGLELSKSLLPTLPIGISGFPIKEAMKKALKDKDIPIEDFWEKRDGPDELQKIINSAIEAEWDFLQGQKEIIDWPNNITPRYLTEKFNKKFAICTSELESLLLKHFRNSRHIGLDHLDSGNRTNSHSLAFRGKSIIFKATITESHESEIVTNRPTLIKIARKERILKEQKNYEKFIKNRLFFHNAAPIRRTTIMWKTGIVEYEFLPEMRNPETSRLTFSEFYSQSSIKIKDIANTVSQIELILESLFNIWHPLLQNKKTQEKTLFQEFDKVWKTDESDVNASLDAKIQKFNIKSKHIQFLDGKIDILNPIAWVSRRVNSRKSLDKSPKKFSSFLAITHGDMHGDNILVEEGYDPIFIDFERTGYGPIFQDFALLEVDLLLRVVHLPNPNESLELFVSLLDNFTLENPPIIASFDNGEIYKAWRTITKIRELAFKHTDNKFTNYLWGLLLNIVFRCVLLQNQIKKEVEIEDIEAKEAELQKALLYGGLICHKLESPKLKWVPKNIAESIQIEPLATKNKINNLYELICKHFNEEEFEELLFKLNGSDKLALHKTNLPGDTYQAKVREYLNYMRRRDRLIEVIEYCLSVRPKLNWLHE